MGNKKKYIIAIVLFVFLGLMIFTFANPNEEEDKKLDNGKNNTEENNNQNDNEENNNETNNENNIINNNINNPVVLADNSYNLALQAVINAENKMDNGSYNNALELVNKVTNNNQKQELEQRLDEVKDGIDAKALVETLANKVNMSENKSDMDDARDYRADEEIVNKVNSLINTTLRQTLQQRLNTLAMLLDDTTSPVINIADGAILSSTTEILIEDDNEFVITIKENGNSDSREIPNGYTVEEGTYELTVIDEAFNETTVAFTIDLSEPKFNVINGSHSNEEFNISIEDLTLDYVEIYNQDTKTKTIETSNAFILTEEATYRLTAYDKAGHKTVVWVAIDKTSPVITGVENNKYYKTDVEVTVSDKFLTKVLVNNIEQDGIVLTGTNNEGKSLVKTFTEEGTYTIVATDKVGNQTTVTFTIDKTKPIITGVENGKYYNYDVTPVIEDANFKNATLKLNGTHIKSYRVGDTLTQEGTYTLVATDLAMNKTKTITFVIDKTLNLPAISYSTIEPTNRNVTVTLTADEEVEVINSGTWAPQEGYATVFKKVYPTNTTQTVTIRDKAGNTNTVEVVITNIDKTAPTAVIAYSTVEPTNRNVTVTLTADEEVEVINSGTWAPQEGYATVFKKVYPTNTTQTVTIRDKAGNTNTVEVVITNIDKTAPTAEITKSNNDKSTNQNVTVTLKTNEVISVPEGWTEVIEGTEFTKVYEENGKYSVVITDKAGNDATVKFEVKRIDKVAPVLTVISPNRYQIEVGSEYIDKGYSAWDVVDKDVTNLIKITYQFQAKGTSTWPFVDSLDTSKLGTYKVIYTAYDKAGNTSKGTRVVQVVDTTAPVVTLNGSREINLIGGVDIYNELKATVNDNYDETISDLSPAYINHYTLEGVFLGRVATVNTNVEGRYNVVYFATDSNGNVSTKVTRLVYVRF